MLERAETSQGYSSGYNRESWVIQVIMRWFNAWRNCYLIFRIKNRWSWNDVKTSRKWCEILNLICLNRTFLSCFHLVYWVWRCSGFIWVCDHPMGLWRLRGAPRPLANPTFDFDALLYDKQVLGTLLIMKITFEWLDVVLHDFLDVEIFSWAKVIFFTTLWMKALLLPSIYSRHDSLIILLGPTKVFWEQLDIGWLPNKK